MIELPINQNFNYTANNAGNVTKGGTPTAANNFIGNVTTSNGTYSMDCFDLDRRRDVELNDDNEKSKKLESLVSVGAGQHVDQKITYVAGLVKPMFSETVRVKYLWWDDLVAKLRTQTTAQEQPSGFPGDAKSKNIDLKETPRVGEKKGSFRRSESQTPVFERV